MEVIKAEAVLQLELGRRQDVVSSSAIMLRSIEEKEDGIADCSGKNSDCQRRTDGSVELTTRISREKYSTADSQDNNTEGAFENDKLVHVTSSTAPIRTTGVYYSLKSHRSEDGGRQRLQQLRRRVQVAGQQDNQVGDEMTQTTQNQSATAGYQVEPATNDSNDGGTATEAEVEYADGYSDMYSCKRKAGNVALGKIEVTYDYEYMAIEDDNSALVEKDVGEVAGGRSLPPTLPAVEWATLWTVSRAMGLHGCHFDGQEIPPSSQSSAGVFPQSGGTRRSLLSSVQPLQYTQPSLVVALSSQPVDQYDTSVASCEFLKPSSSGEVCYPMRGAMTVKYVGHDPIAVQNYVLLNIARELNSQSVLTEGVTQTLFLGNRAEYTRPFAAVEVPPDSLSTQSSGGEVPYIPVTAAISGFALLAVLVTTFLFFRKRRRTIESNVVSQEDLEAQVMGKKSYTERSCSPGPKDILADAGELQESACPGSPAKSVKTIDSNETLKVSNKQSSSIPILPILSSNSTDSLSIATPESGDSDNAIASSESVEAVAVAQSTNARAVDVLPPLPPSKTKSKPPIVAALPSKTMKRRRKKKKKKLQKGLARVSSRDNIKEMETIDEAAEEVSGEGEPFDDDDDDAGSEYSWSTDEGSDHSRSRDPSPSRSDPNPDISSSSNSPSRSESF